MRITATGCDDYITKPVRKQKMMEKVERSEEANREFAERIVHAEKVNTTLCIATSRLHSVLERVQVIGVVKKVVINFVRVDHFALLLCDREGRTLRYEPGEGFEGKVFPPVVVGEGGGGAVQGCESF